MKILILSIGLILQYCTLEAAENDDYTPKGFVLINSINLNQLTDDTEVNLPSAKVIEGFVPCIALEIEGSNLNAYNIGLQKEFLANAYNNNDIEIESMQKGVNIFNNPFQSVVLKDEIYHGKNWNLPGDVIIGCDKGFDLYQSFFNKTITMQACNPILSNQLFSFRLAPFTAGAYFEEQLGFCSFVFDPSKPLTDPNSFRGNMLVDGVNRSVFFGENLTIQIKKY